MPTTTANKDAFAHLLHRGSIRLILFIRRQGPRFLGADFDADDVLQVTLTRAWELRDRVKDEDPESIYRWLVAIARNSLRDRRKYQRAQGRDRFRHLESASRVHDPLASNTPVSRVLMRDEQIKEIERSLEALPVTTRRAVELYYLEGRPLKELETELGLPRSTVWDRLSRGIAELRRALEREGL